MKTNIVISFRSSWATLLPGFLIMLFVLSSCDKDHWFDFSKSTGPQITMDRKLDGTFNKLSMQDNINVVITKGSNYSLTLEGGKNLLPSIETKIKDSTLIISNLNTYNWVRTYDEKITAYLTLPQISDIRYESTGTLTNTDTIREDSLNIQSNGGSGYIDLVIRTGTVKLAIITGSADLKVSGYTGISFVFSGSMGAIRTYDLLANYIFMHNAGTNNCYVNVREHFEYQISGIGDICYKGNPGFISGVITGKGKLRKTD